MENFFPQQVKDLVNEIVVSHNQRAYMSSEDSETLPNRDTIIDIIRMFREVLFPVYFCKQYRVNANLEYPIGSLILNIYEKLHTQVVRALKHRAVKTNDMDHDFEQQAATICWEFLSKIPSIMEVLSTDVQAAFDGDPAAEDIDEIIFSYPGLYALSIFRLAHELYLLSVPLIPRIMTEHAHSRTGIDIHAGATIGRYFFIDHGTGVVIGETTSIGDYVTLYQGVTIGALSTRGGQLLRGKKRHPTIEDRVVVYSGASILGGETVIGERVVIGSNVFITKSVPAGTMISLKNQELIYKGRAPEEFKQEFPDQNS